LDVNLLKTEIGVMAFGKRTRIANAITDLRQSHPRVDKVHQERSSMWSSLPPPSSPEHHTSLRLDIQVHETRQERFSMSESSTGVRGEIPSPSLPLRRSPQRSDKISETSGEKRSPLAPPRSMRRPLPTISQVSSTPSDSLNGEAEEARTPFNDSWQATEEGKKTEKMTPDMASILRRNAAYERRISQASKNSNLVVRKDSVGIGAMLSGSILHQIGEPDHVGWLRKKNDRYNFWKPRYFILKGQHLYWFKSAKPLVSVSRLNFASSTHLCCRRGPQKELSTLWVTRSLPWMTPLILLVVMDSGLTVIKRGHTSLALITKMLFAIGQRPL
jgi:hypothetical protein